MVIFHLLKFDTSFFNIPVPVVEWPYNAQYRAAEEVVYFCNVMNEGAERDVKLAYGFLDVARKNSNF